MSVLVHLKGKNLFIPHSIKNVNVDILIAFSNKEDLSDVSDSSFQILNTKIEKGRIHWLEVDVSTLDFTELQNSKYIVYGIKPIDGIINIKKSNIKHFPKHRNSYRNPRTGRYDLDLFSTPSERIPQIKLKLTRN